MSSAVSTQTGYDQTDLPLVMRGAVKLGAIQAVAVLAFSLAIRFLPGLAGTLVGGLIILAGVAATTILPGLWTRARATEGIAGAAGIGLGATVTFLLIDVALLQPIGTYGNRWLELGGGSNWWYHPVWWMAGTFLAWMGATVLANQTTKSGQSSPRGLLVTSLVLTVALGALAVVVGFPGAGWSLGTFSVAFLPGIALTAVFSWMGARRT